MRFELFAKLARRTAYLAPLAVFLASACIMIIELVAGRLMSRFIGQSLYTWTAVIGLILAGITLGNVIGGRLADRFRAAPLFASIFLASSLSALLIPVLNNWGGHWEWLLGCETRLRIFLHVGLTFLLPAVALGTIGPVAATMAVESHKGTGKALGDIYAWSAAGSIVGTFVTGYYLIAAIGTAATLVLAAGILFALGLLFAVTAWSLARSRIIAIGIGIPFFLLAVTGVAHPTWWMATMSSPDSEPVKTLFSRESPYSLVSVSARENLPKFRQLYLDRLPHSEVDASNPTNLMAGYTWLIQGAIEARYGATQAVSMLVVGGGGYAIPRQVQATRPGSRMVVAEIDPVVTEAAMAACGLTDTNGMEIHHVDGRQVVQALVRERTKGKSAGTEPGPPKCEKIPSAGMEGRPPCRPPVPESVQRFDCVIGDTVEYYSLPYHLATKEFAQEVATILKPDGIYLLHIVTERKRGGAYLGAILNTLAQVFPKVSVVALKSNPELYTSYLFVACRAEAGEIRPAGLDIAGCIRAAHPVFHGEQLSDGVLAHLREQAAGAILTDDHAPLEQLVEPVVRGDRRDVIRFRLGRCREALREGQIDRAEREARAAVSADDSNAEAHYVMALVLQQRREWAKAVAEVTRVLDIDPEIFPAQILKGTLLAASGDVVKACEEWRAVLVLRPKNLDALQGLAYASEYQDAPREAMKQWAAILELLPDDATALYAMARLSKREGWPDEASRYMTALKRVDPEMKKIRPNPLPIKSVAQALENLAL